MFGKGVLFEGSESGAIAIGFFIAQAKNPVAPDSDQTFQLLLTAGNEFDKLLFRHRLKSVIKLLLVA